MKKTNFILIGATAMLIVVALNLLHASYDYGLNSSSLWSVVEAQSTTGESSGNGTHVICILESCWANSNCETKTSYLCLPKHIKDGGTGIFWTPGLGWVGIGEPVLNPLSPEWQCEWMNYTYQECYNSVLGTMRKECSSIQIGSNWTYGSHCSDCKSYFCATGT